MTGVTFPAARMRERASMPFKRGIMMSITIQSKAWAAAASTASAPSLATTAS